MKHKKAQHWLGFFMFLIFKTASNLFWTKQFWPIKNSLLDLALSNQIKNEITCLVATLTPKPTAFRIE